MSFVCLSDTTPTVELAGRRLADLVYRNRDAQVPPALTARPLTPDQSNIQTVCGAWLRDVCQPRTAAVGAIFSQITLPNITFSRSPARPAGRPAGHPQPGSISAIPPSAAAPAARGMCGIRGQRERTSPTLRRGKETSPTGTRCLASAISAHPVTQRERNGAALHLDARCGGRQFYDVPLHPPRGLSRQQHCL